MSQVWKKYDRELGTMEGKNDQEKINNDSKFETISIMLTNDRINLARERELRHVIINSCEVGGWDLDGQPCLLLCNMNICIYTDNVICLPSDTLKLIIYI